MESLIKQFTPIDLLNEFYNAHLRQYLESEINIMIFSKLDPREIIGQRQYPMGSSKPPAILSISAKEALEKEQKKLELTKKVLDNIKELRMKYEQNNFI